MPDQIRHDEVRNPATASVTQDPIRISDSHRLPRGSWDPLGTGTGTCPHSRSRRVPNPRIRSASEQVPMGSVDSTHTETTNGHDNRLS